MNAGDPRLRRAWLAPLAACLNSLPPGRLLDFGCGHGDLKALLPMDWEVQGYDPDKSLGAAHHELETLPDGPYDVVVCHSVLQYFSGADEVARFLAFCRERCHRDSRIFLTDLIPTDYPAYLDALSSLGTAWKSGAFPAMLGHLARAGWQRDGWKSGRYSPSALASLAEREGFRLTTLPGNLSPSPYRWSAVLTRTEHADQGYAPG